MYIREIYTALQSKASIIIFFLTSAFMFNAEQEFLFITFMGIGVGLSKLPDYIILGVGGYSTLGEVKAAKARLGVGAALNYNFRVAYLALLIATFMIGIIIAAIASFLNTGRLTPSFFLDFFGVWLQIGILVSLPAAITHTIVSTTSP